MFSFGILGPTFRVKLGQSSFIRLSVDTLWTEVHTAWIGCYVYFTAVWPDEATSIASMIRQCCLLSVNDALHGIPIIDCTRFFRIMYDDLLTLSKYLFLIVCRVLMFLCLCGSMLTYCQSRKWIHRSQSNPTFDQYRWHLLSARCYRSNRRVVDSWHCRLPAWRSSVWSVERTIGNPCAGWYGAPLA